MYTFTGCSGFHYDDWKRLFYPEELSKSEWLPYYAEHFKTVEINNSFYRIPKKKTLEKWHGQTPGNFRFTMKGNRYITHRKKLVDDEHMRERLKFFYEVIEVLEGKLGCVLWQIPGNLHRKDEKLEKFCSRLSPDFKNVMEFRHKSWFVEPVMEILKKHNVSYCILSAPDNLPEQFITTSDTAYVRFHGKKEWYRYNYSDKELKEWSDRIKELKAERVYLYFNNDYEAHAVFNGQKMRELLDE
ncbi:MAG TPA: DUF72 domain-containing protein [Balneolaceae bacterium]